MNENGSKSPKMNGIIKIEISQLSKLKQMNQITKNDLILNSTPENRL